MVLANSIIPKNVLPRLRTEENLEVALTDPKINIVEVGEIDEIDQEPDDGVETLGETEYVEIRDVENIIPAWIQKIKQHEKESNIGL
jgi:hypothetical protein